MRRMRVYVAVPLTHDRDRERAQYICESLRGAGFEATSPWVAEEDAKQALIPQEVYDRDVLAVAVSDAVVAEVSVPSLGIGMELMVAVSKGMPIACLHEKGRTVSWMVLGAPGVHLVPYTLDCIDEGLKNTTTWLRSLPVVSSPKTFILRTNKEVSQCIKTYCIKTSRRNQSSRK